MCTIIVGVFFIAIIILTQTIEGKPARPPKPHLNQNKNNEMIFPESAEEEVRFFPINKCENKQLFCEDVEDYPKAELEEILSKISYKTAFDSATSLDEVDDSLGTRYGDSEQYLCPFIRRTIWPKLAKNVKKEWKFIYNFDGYTQGIRITICQKETTCNIIAEPPLGYTSQCKQQYIETRLLSAGVDGKPVFDYFLLPFGCACSYKRAIVRFLGGQRS